MESNSPAFTDQILKTSALLGLGCYSESILHHQQQQRTSKSSGESDPTRPNRWGLGSQSSSQDGLGDKSAGRERGVVG